MRSTTFVATFVAVGAAWGGPGLAARLQAAPVPPDPVVRWSLEAQRAIVPPPAGVGNKFPGEAAVYMGIVHAAIYDAAVAIEGGYRPYAIAVTAPAGTSPEAAVAAAAHGVLVGVLPAQQADLDARYAAYLAGIPEGDAKVEGIAIGQTIAAAMLALRAADGRDDNPQYVQPPPGPGVFEPEPGRPVLGLRLSRIRPLALASPWEVRPDGPHPLASPEYAADYEEVKDLGRSDSASRTSAQTELALFWTDHDLRQWNEAMLRIAAGRGLGLVETARMLALAHVSGGDAMIGCFDAKFHFMAWRPSLAIPRGDADSNPATAPDASWRPLRPTPNFPEYPSAHACHSSATAEALAAFFGTDHVPFTLDSRVTGTTRHYDGFRAAVKEVNRARVLAGFHFRNSDQEGSNLGRRVARAVADAFFQSLP